VLGDTPNIVAKLPHLAQPDTVVISEATLIALLQTLPETLEHTQQALTLHLTLGASLLMTKGQAASEVEHAYSQAHALCQQVGETP
jgi:hypothetical protein